MKLRHSRARAPSFEMKASIIAFGYYDGPTEGLAVTIGGSGPWYFRLVAWDEGQDRRLFAAVRVESTLYDRLIVLIPEEQHSFSAVWTPSWNFALERDQSEADAIVDSCLNSLRQRPGCWVLGERVDDNAKVFPVEAADGDDLQRVLSSDQPDDLAPWLSRLNGRV